MDVLSIQKAALSKTEAQQLYNSKRAFFDAGQTRSYQFRRSQLKKLYAAIQSYESAFLDALQKDLHKHPTEAFATEIGIVLHEISYSLKHLKGWMRPKRVGVGLASLPASARIHPDPLGVSLIIGPWNYPMQLIFAPLVGAIAAGCCVVVKPPEEAPHTAQVIEDLIHSTFDEHYISVVQGPGAEVVPVLMNTVRFDHVFFTGSTTVGRIIAKQCSDKLIPHTLELGGKSPTIVHSDAKLDIAARRIAWGKFLNAGQTCIAPDYLLLHRSIKEAFIERIQYYIRHFYGENAQQSDAYARIINTKNFNRLTNYLQDGTIIEGGKVDAADHYIEPTLIDAVKLDDLIMKEEIFGPILPILTYDKLEEIYPIIARNSHPLALYLFTEDKRIMEEIVERIQFGGACINQTVHHFGSTTLPAGGVGYSGIGKYHGRASFDTFVNNKAVLNAATWIDPMLKYPPYKDLLLKALRLVFR